MEIKARIPFVGAGWENRSINEKPKVQAHGGAHYRPRRSAHRGELLTRTAPGRLGLLLGGVILLGLFTAAIGHFIFGAFSSFGDAVWSGITHLLDPGQLGDDNTTAERTVGVLQVLIGIVFLAGIVLTVLSELFNRALRRIDQGDPSIKARDHLLVIGMNDTLEEVARLLGKAHPDGRPFIVTMLPPDQAGERAAAQRALSKYPGRSRVVVADPNGDGFDRVCATEAGRIVILSPPGRPDRADLRVTAIATGLVRHLEAGNWTCPPVAAEFRRGRNVDALWFAHDGSGETPPPRFPAMLDALVDDRSIGALLSLVVLNPDFSGIFLSQDDEANGPSLLDAGEYAGQRFGSIRESLEGATLLGLLEGRGPEAVARYLPPEDEAIRPGDRLIVIRDESRRNDDRPGIDPESIKVAPTRPGPLLILGFSDSASALLDALQETDLDPQKITVLAPEAVLGAKSPGRPRINWIAGDPCDPVDIDHAIGRSGPAIIFAAAPPDEEADAVISGHLARRTCVTPIIVEQRAADRDLPDLASSGITMVSTSALTAETVALSLADPALVVARETMLTDPGLVLESLTYTGSSQLPLQDLPGIFSKAGYYPMAVSLSGDDADGLAPGDHILAMSRIG